MYIHTYIYISLLNVRLFGCSVKSDSLPPHGLQHTRLPCPSPSPVKWSENLSVASDSLWPHGLYNPWNSPGQSTGLGSLSLLQGIFPTQGLNPGVLNCRQILLKLMSIESVISSSHLILCHPLLLLPSIFPNIRVFSNELFELGGQSIEVSSSASVLPMNIQDWFLLGWTDLISFQSKRLSRVFSSTIVRRHQFFHKQRPTVCGQTNSKGLFLCFWARWSWLLGSQTAWGPWGSVGPNTWLNHLSAMDPLEPYAHIAKQQPTACFCRVSTQMAHHGEFPQLKARIPSSSPCSGSSQLYHLEEFSFRGRKSVTFNLQSRCED